MHPVSTRRTFLAHSALGLLAAGMPPAAAAQVSAGMQVPAACAAVTPAQSAPPAAAAPGAKRTPMLRMAPPYDKATINLLGPRPGYSPQVGTMVSMLTWMEHAVLGPTRDLWRRIPRSSRPTTKPSGARRWTWGLRPGGDQRTQRRILPGYDPRGARVKTLAEFAKREDAWLTTALKEPGWGGPINNYCLWFHVCEHIPHHAGQIDFLIKASARRQDRRRRWVSRTMVME